MANFLKKAEDGLGSFASDVGDVAESGLHKAAKGIRDVGNFFAKPFDDFFHILLLIGIALGVVLLIVFIVIPLIRGSSASPEDAGGFIQALQANPELLAL